MVGGNNTIKHVCQLVARFPLSHCGSCFPQSAIMMRFGGTWYVRGQGKGGDGKGQGRRRLNSSKHTIPPNIRIIIKTRSANTASRTACQNVFQKPRYLLACRTSPWDALRRKSTCMCPNVLPKHAGRKTNSPRGKRPPRQRGPPQMETNTKPKDNSIRNPADCRRNQAAPHGSAQS